MLSVLKQVVWFIEHFSCLLGRSFCAHCRMHPQPVKPECRTKTPQKPSDSKLSRNTSRKQPPKKSLKRPYPKVSEPLCRPAGYILSDIAPPGVGKNIPGSCPADRPHGRPQTPSCRRSPPGNTCHNRKKPPPRKIPPYKIRHKYQEKPGNTG